MTSDEAVIRYGRMSEAQSLGLGGTIALPPGVSPRQALKLSVSDRMTELSLAPGFRERVSQRFDPPPHRSIIEAGVEDYWTPAVEDASGYHATESGKAEARSRNGDAVLVYRSVNAGMLLQHTKGHVLLRSFDPLMPGTHEQVGTPLQEVGLDFRHRGPAQLLSNPPADRTPHGRATDSRRPSMALRPHRGRRSSPVRRQGAQPAGAPTARGSVAQEAAFWP